MVMYSVACGFLKRFSCIFYIPLRFCEVIQFVGSFVVMCFLVVTCVCCVVKYLCDGTVIA